MKNIKILSLGLLYLVSLMLFVSCDNDSSTDPESDNTKPVANFIVSPESGTVETEFSFDASATSDAEDESSALRVRWDFDNDGNFETAWTTEKTATQKYDAIGTYSVKLEVKDSGGLVSEKIKTVVVSNNPNTAPVADFIVNPASGTVETEFSFDASSSSDAEDQAGSLEVRFDFDNNGDFETSWSTEKTATHKYDAIGTYSVKLEVKDSGGLVSEKIKTVVVSNNPNTAPVANFTVSPEEGDLNTEFLFDASASSDAEDDISALRVRWDFDNDGNFETDWSTEKTAVHTYDIAGAYIIKLEVKDSGGLVSENIKAIVVNEIPNTAPVADFTINPEEGDLNTEFLFDASASSDAEDDISALNIRWDFNGDNQFDTDWSTEKTATYTYSTAGTYSVKLEVKDSGDLVSEKIKTVVVEKPAPEGTVLVVGGSFMMGNVIEDPYGNEDEIPVHEVTVNSFYMGKYEITNSDYCKFLNSEGNQEEGGATWLCIADTMCQIVANNGVFEPKSGKDKYPVIMVTWYGARAYAEWKGGRLPTEAEWEYAARGGNKSNGYKYAGSNNLDNVGWYYGNSQNPDNEMYFSYGSHIVGEKEPNELGIYDMSGNVWEWCNDWYDYEYYSSSPSDNPQGADGGEGRVYRGGSWRHHAKHARVANRSYGEPNASGYTAGFRIVLDY